MIEFIDKTHRQIITFNNDLGHLYVPNLKARLIDESGGYYIKTNSLGFRSNIEFKKEKKKKRILFFGDSNTAADGVSNENRYSDLLAKYFDAEVFNFAVSGTGTDQQYLTWKKYAKDIQADLIVIGSLVENIERNKVEFRQTINSFSKEATLTSKPYFKLENEKLILQNYPVKKFKGKIENISKNKVQWSIPENNKLLYFLVNFVRKNFVYKFLNKKYSKKFILLRSSLIRNFYQPFKDYKNPNSKGYKITKAIFEKFTNEAASIPIIIMPIPTYHYYFDGAKPIYQNFYKLFENIKKKIFVFDPLSEIKNLNFEEKSELCLKNDKAHFSIFGHQLLANFLKKKVKELNIFRDTNNFEKKSTTNITKIKSIYVLGISAFYHDSAATLIKDGKIISAAQEERFTRKKNDQSYPKYSINYCLEEAGIEPKDLSAVIFYDNAYLSLERIAWNYLETFPRSIKNWNKYMPRWLTYKLFVPKLIRKNLKYEGKILHNEHHRSHLASAFYPSPFQNSAILTVDGVGEWATASIGVGEGNKIKMIKEMLYPDSVGLLYSAFTQFLGFKVNSGEYKMMGLAPYGKPIYSDLILNKLINLAKDGSIKINQEYFSYLDGDVMTNKNFAKLFKCNPRKPESKITQKEMDIACSIQRVIEKIVLKMATYAKEITGQENLCLSGGVALNCVANGFLLRANIFKNIWIQPASGDAGSSLGSALDAYYTYFNKSREIREDGISSQLGSLLGPSYKNEEIKSYLESVDQFYHFFENNNDRNKIIAKKIKEGKVVGLFLGRTEFGPRALGSRSIVADPRSKDMQTKLNVKIKFRESFRPFAPAIISEETKNYFDMKTESPFMMLVAPITKNKRVSYKKTNSDNMLEIVKKVKSQIPAVTHVDYSARIQTVNKNINNDFYQIIEEFNRQTGCPILINTSFNVRGEPIVNSPQDAHRCFMKTNMDLLVLENFIIEKDNNIEIQKQPSNKKKTVTVKKNLNFLRKDLIKIYSQLKNINVKKYYHQSSGWHDSNQPENIKKIFEITDELDREIVDPAKMSKEILYHWKNKKFALDMKIIIFNLINLSKKIDQANINTSNEISKNVYEMF
jgi:carbamoyltransferase